MRSVIPAVRVVLAFNVTFILFAMMWWTVADVAGRDLFGSPLPGGFEVTEWLMAIVIFSGLPLITFSNGHVTVTLIDNFVSDRVRARLKFAAHVASFALLLFLAWGLHEVADGFRQFGDRTMFLGLPIAPLAYFMVALTIMSAPIHLLLAWRDIRNDTARQRADV